MVLTSTIKIERERNLTQEVWFVIIINLCLYTYRNFVVPPPHPLTTHIPPPTP